MIARRRHRNPGEPTSHVDRAVDWLIAIGAHLAPDPERRVRVRLRRAGIHTDVHLAAQIAVGLAMNGRSYLFLRRDEPRGEAIDVLLLCDEWVSKA